MKGQKPVELLTAVACVGLLNGLSVGGGGKVTQHSPSSRKRWVSKAACRILHTFIETFHWRARMRRNANKGRHCQTCSQNGAAAQLKGRRRFFGTRRLAVPKWLKIHCGAVIVEASHSLLGGTEQKEATPRTSCRLPVKRRCFLTKTPLSAEHVAGGGCYGSVSATLSSSSIKEHTGHFLL